MDSPTPSLFLVDKLTLALPVILFTALGFRLRLGRHRWEGKAGDNVPPAALCRLGTSLCLVGFAALLGLFFTSIFAQLFGLPVPGSLGGLAVATLVRNTTELSDWEFPQRETDILGLVSLLLLAVAWIL